MILAHCHVGVTAERTQQCVLDLPSREVLCMDDPPARVTPFPSQRQAVFIAREAHAPVHEFADARRPFCRELLDSAAVTETCARDQRITHVQLRAVVRTHHRRNAALCVVGAGGDALFFVISVTRACSAALSAKLRPAMPLPMTSTSLSTVVIVARRAPMLAAIPLPLPRQLRLAVRSTSRAQHRATSRRLFRLSPGHGPLPPRG